MQNPLSDPQIPSRKVKNILIRHSCPRRVQYENKYQHPEASYILKYAPKYYKSLILQATTQSSLLTKVKKIKKLKVFMGCFDRHLPQKLWFNLLGNTRKEIEEAPQLCPNKARLKPSNSFWRRFNQQKLKDIWNLNKIRRGSDSAHDLDNFLSCKKSFVKHLRNLRKLKSLEIEVKDGNAFHVKWVLAKLNGMKSLFKRLEILNLELSADSQPIKELFQNKNLFCNLTGLEFSLNFDPIFVEVLQLCKNLNSLSLGFYNGVDEKPEFRDLLISVQQLNQLKYLDFNWPADGKDFWSYFKLQSSLEYLVLRFTGYDLVRAELFVEDKMKDAVAHWEEIKKLKALEFYLSCSNSEEYNLVKIFITKVLKKIQKLESLKIWIWSALENEKTCELFVMENVQHLYESLENLNYRLYSIWKEEEFVEFDLGTLMAFKNLKSLKIGGNMEFHENIGDIMGLLERNEKKGEYPVLELNLKKSIRPDWLRNTLEIIERAKRMDRELKVIIDLTFGLEDYLEVLEELCRSIQSVRTIKGLRIFLNFDDDTYFVEFNVSEVRELLERYPEMRNLNVKLSSALERLEFIRIDGKKEQFFVN